MAGELVFPSTQVVAVTLAATGASAPFALRQAEAYYAEAVVTASAGTVDVALQHSTDNGVTWQTLPLKFAQVAAAGAASAPIAFKTTVGISDAAAAFAPALTGPAQSANIPFNIRNVRAFVTLGTAGATTISLRFTMLPKGATSIT